MGESDFCKWIEKKSIKANDQMEIEETIKAFSEYVCTVDQEYQYNKTFLNGFIDYFVGNTMMLQAKKKCMLQIVDRLKAYKEFIIIKVDDAWVYDGKKETENKNPITLSKTFDRWSVNSNTINYQIRYIQDPGFVIAGTIDMTKQKKDIEEVFSLFIDRLNKDENKGL